jgi:hypothetical protein
VQSTDGKPFLYYVFRSDPEKQDLSAGSGGFVKNVRVPPQHYDRDESADRAAASILEL